MYKKFMLAFVLCICSHHAIAENQNLDQGVVQNSMPELSYTSSPDGEQGEVDLFLEDVPVKQPSQMQIWLQEKGARVFTLYLTCKSYMKNKYKICVAWMAKKIGSWFVLPGGENG